MTRWDRFRASMRNAATSLLVAVSVFVALEIALAVFAPQHLRLVETSGGERGVEDSELGHRYRPNTEYTATGPEFEVVYRINRHGHRDDTPYSPHNPSDSVRVLLVGDSFTFGAGVSAEDSWPVVTESLLHQRGVPACFVNAGTEGYDTRSEFLLLQRIFDDVDPDVVLLGFVANDVVTNAPAEAVGRSSRYVHTGEHGLRRLHTPVLAKRLLFRNDAVYMRTYVSTGRGDYFKTPRGPKARKQIEVTSDLLRDLHRFCDARGVPLVVVSLPQLFQVLVQTQGFGGEDIDVNGIDNELAEVARELGFAWVPMLAALSEATARDVKTYHRIDGHLTAAGNGVVAAFLADALEPVLSTRPPNTIPSR